MLKAESSKVKGHTCDAWPCHLPCCLWCRGIYRTSTAASRRQVL